MAQGGAATHGPLYHDDSSRALSESCYRGIALQELYCVDAGGREQAGAQTSGERPSPPSPMPESQEESQLVKDEATNIASSSARGHKKDSSSLSSPPSTAAFVNKVAGRIPAKWKLFAYNLDIEDDTLDAIELKYHDPIDCFMKVFRAWKKNPSLPFTWETVIKVLQSPVVGEMTIAAEIRQSHDL